MPEQHPAILAKKHTAQTHNPPLSGATPSDFASLASHIAACYDPSLAYTVATYQKDIFPFSPALNIINDRLALLELYHGPTCAFKDFGASFLAYNMEKTLVRTQKRQVILVATSGDTGSAVAHAFYKKKNIAVVVLYPARRISALQEAHITSFGENIRALEVRGTFDQCQALVKRAFIDQEIAEDITLSSANSINIGRLLPQSFYFHYAYQLLRPSLKGGMHFCVPSGNMGNVTAGVLAWKTGLPVDSFIVATNSNKTIPLYLDSGIYTPRRTVRTISNAMDVGNPNNFERAFTLYDKNYQRMARHMHGYSASEHETRDTIHHYYTKYGITVDPHTATALSAAQKHRHAMDNHNDMIVCVSTAHPSKFKTAVERVIKDKIPLAPQLEDVEAGPQYKRCIKASYNLFKEYLLSELKE